MDDLHLLTAAELTAAYSRNELSPVEVARAALDRATRTAETLNAFVFVDEASALDAARGSERRWLEGRSLGALDGVPVAPKDSMLVAGWPTRIASQTTSKQPASEDTPYVARLRAAGAVFIGKTTTPEYCWTGWTQSIVNGVTRNPWNLDRTVGGSSGGAGAALAGGIVPVALGTDAGGSIRTPAALTGMVGFKPSTNRVPLHKLEGNSNLNSAGPLATSVADAIAVFALMTGEAEKPLDGSASSPLAGLRVAFSSTMGYARHVAGEIAAGLREAAAVLAGLGAHVAEDAPEIAWPIDTYNTIGWAEQAYNLREVVAARGSEMEPGLVEIVGIGQDITIAEYISAQQQRWAIDREMRSFLTGYDLLLTPSLPVTAFSANKIAPDSDKVTGMNNWLPFSSIFNLTGQPALTLPFGFDAEGLPYGVQIVGRLGEDWNVLTAARHLEVASIWREETRRRRKSLP